MRLTTREFTPVDGGEFLEYMQRVIIELTRLQSEGRVPDDEGVESLLTFWRLVTSQVRFDIDRAGAASRTPITSSMPMTEAEHQRIWAMFDTLYPLLEILEIRGAIDLQRSEGVARVVNAVYRATLAPK